MTTKNPFENEPENSGGKMLFGTYRLVTNNVDLETGYEGYADGRYTMQDGTPRHFKGKKLNPKSKNVHVIQELTSEAKDGHEYISCRDWMYWASDVCAKAVMPSHKQHFGDKLESIFGKTAEVQVEQVEIDDKGYTRQCWKIVKVFKNKAERNAAREAYFAKFDNGNGSSAATVTADASEDETLAKYKAAIVKNLTERKKSVDEVAKGFASVGVTLEQVQAIKDAIDDGLPV